MKKIYSLILLLTLLSCSVFAQNRTVTGTVTSSDKNEPLIGVSVQVKGGGVGTQTDVNGKFSLKVTNLQNVVLGFTYVSYNYQEHTLKIGETTLNVSMSPSENNLNDVVITSPYGSQRKATLTGAISVVDLKKVEDIPALNMGAVLRGTVPGLSVSGGTSRPGQGTTITIRNPVVFSKDSEQGTSPLFVIDDVIRTKADFDLLDPIQVESVSILKDAEAAIYGVSGANGVIIVRTKRGRQGPPRISFSSSLGLANATTIPKMMSSLELGTYLNDYYQGRAAQAGYPNSGNSYIVDVTSYQRPYYTPDGILITPGFALDNNILKGTGTSKTADTRVTDFYTPDELDYFSTHSHNYLKEAFQTSQVWREALSISGGNDKVTYFIGGDYVNQNSNFKGINSNKYGLRASVEAKPAKGLTTSLSLSTDVSYNRSYFYKLNSTTESLDNDAATLQNVQPWQEYFINGNPVILGSSNTGGIDNINFFQVQKSNNFTGGTSYITNILGKITYEIPGVKGLTATATMNKNINAANNKQFGTTFNYYKYAGTGTNNHIPGGALVNIYPISNGDRIRLTPTFANSYQLDAGLNYNRTFGKHSIGVLALFEQREQTLEGVAAEADGVIAGALPYQTFTAGAQISTQTGQLSTSGFMSYITRFNYSYADKYLLQLIYRADGSSRFKPGNNWGGFPAASVGWVASQESFFKEHTPWIDLLKFRASVGITGTDATKAYQYNASYNLGTGSGGGAVFNGNADRTTAIKSNISIPNGDVQWDTYFKTDYGIDASFLKSRLNFTADYFWNHGYDLLATLQSSVPATIGAAVPTENYGKVNTFGYELSLGWRDHIGKSFTYSFTPFFTWSDNKLLKYDLSTALVGTIQDLTGGSSDHGTFGYRSLGLIRTQEEANAIIAARSAAAGGNQNVKILGQAVQPGMINYEDVDGNGVISTDDKDKQYLNKRASNHNSLGLNFSVGYGALNLNVIAGMSWGGVTTLDGKKPFNQSSSGAAITDNRPAYWTDHWTPTNTNAKYPAPYFLSNYDVASDFWLVSSTTLNITSMNLSYSLPTKLVGKIGMASARVYAVATNPVQFINPFPDHYRDFQTALYSYPSLRTVSLGINVGF
jgi:TonB-linked SusC/RagA family outer membrane protein